MDWTNIILGICLIIVGLLLGIPELNELFTDKQEKFGDKSHTNLIALIGLVAAGIFLIIREL